MAETLKLRKGENFNLSRNFSGQTKFKIGLSWDKVEGRKSFDLDLIIVQLTDRIDNGGKVVDLDHVVFYGSNDPSRPGNDKRIFTCSNGSVGFKDPEGAVLHYGDNRTGEGDGDDESIDIDFNKINPKTKSIVALSSIYDPDKEGLNFGMVKNPKIRLYQGDSDISELTYELREDYSGKSCLEFIELYLYNNEWKMSALGDGNENDLEAELKKFGIPVEG